MRISDWSSDVCSSDLAVALDVAQVEPGRLQPLPLELHDPRLDDHTPDPEGGIAVAGGEHPADAGPAAEDRESVVEGKGVSVRVDLGGRRIIKKKEDVHKQKHKMITNTLIQQVK